MTPEQQLAAIQPARRPDGGRAGRGASARSPPAWPPQGIALLDAAETGRPSSGSFLKSYFATGVLPVLTPLGADELDPLPAAARAETATWRCCWQPRSHRRSGREARIAAGPRWRSCRCPAALPRFITMPAAKGLCLVRLEEVIGGHMDALFPGYQIVAQSVFRITRDADVDVDEDDAADLIEAMRGGRARPARAGRWCG